MKLVSSLDSLLVSGTDRPFVIDTLVSTLNMNIPSAIEAGCSSSVALCAGVSAGDVGLVSAFAPPAGVADLIGKDGQTQTHAHTPLDHWTPIAGGDDSDATAEAIAACAGIAPFNSLQG